MKRKVSSYLRFIACLLSLAVPIASAPSPAAAMLIPTDMTTANTVPSPQRMQDMQKIQRVLESKVLQNRLHHLGMNETEINAKLSRLSDAQVHQFAGRVDKATAGGDGGLLIALLVVGILVLLFIYLLRVVIR